jgi:hypothetical protein
LLGLAAGMAEEIYAREPEAVALPGDVAGAHV